MAKVMRVHFMGIIDVDVENMTEIGEVLNTLREQGSAEIVDAELIEVDITSTPPYPHELWDIEV